MALHALLHVASVDTAASFLSCGGNNSFTPHILMRSFGFHDFRTHYSAIILAGSVHVQVVLPDMKCFFSVARAQLLSFPWLEALG